MKKEYKLSDKVVLKGNLDSVAFEFSPKVDEKDFTSYKITKSGEFGNMIKLLMDLLSYGSSQKVIKIQSMAHDLLELKATIYGLTLLKLIFFKPYFNIEKL